jgi:ABC-type nitrate/sulfonate/bicarbonate transport system substrate-binding protein
MASPLDRRSFLRNGALAGAGLLAAGALPTLAGCSSDEGSADASAEGDLGSVSQQLPWIKDVQFAGDYLAETKGYWADRGLGVTTIAGGPNVAALAAMVSGKALVTQSHPDSIAAALTEGAELTILGAKFQRSPLAITSPAGSPITEPSQLVGKRIGVQPNNDIAWTAFLEINDIDPASVPTVVAGFDPSPLSNGEVDGWVSFITDEPVTLAAAGFPNTTMSFADFGFDTIANCVVVRSDSLEGTPRKQLAAYLYGLIKGWQDAIADPDEATKVALEDFGGDLDQDPATAKEVLTANNELMTDQGDLTTGLFTISPERIDQTIALVDQLGGELPSSTFDLSIIEEVYDGSTSL